MHLSTNSVWVSCETAVIPDDRFGTGRKVRWIDTIESRPSLGEDLLDRAPVLPVAFHCGWVSYMRTATTKPETAVSPATA